MKRKPAWARRPRQKDDRSVIEQLFARWQANAVNEATETFNEQVSTTIAEVTKYERYNGEPNGSYTHWGLRLYDVPELDAQKATLAWLHANGYLTRKAVSGDGTYFERTSKGSMHGEKDPYGLEPRPRQRFRRKA